MWREWMWPLLIIVLGFGILLGLFVLADRKIEQERVKCAAAGGVMLVTKVDRICLRRELVVPLP